MNIVIPSYEKHISYNVNFLESFRKHCNDKEYVTINFICCNYNKNIFLKLKENFNDLNINIFTLSQLIKKVDNIDFDDSPNNFNTKYPLQSLKKLLSFSVVDSDYLVLDSENLCIKDFYFREVIDIIKNKKIKYTIKNYINNPFELLIIDNCNELINFNNNSFSFLDPYWYFEKDIVLKLMTELVEIHQNKIIFILKDILFFEYQLYSTFCFKHNLKQKISTDEILIDEKVLKNNLNDEKYNPLGHTYHYICSTITDETIDSYIKLLNNLDERITRLHWMPEKLANKIIEHTKVSIGTFHWD
jgi:hypothetical protein